VSCRIACMGINVPNVVTSCRAHSDMRRDGFLLGVVATGGQVLMLRELISSLQGDELFIGTALCGWLLWGALGAYLGGKRGSSASTVLLFVLASLLVPVVVIIARLSPLIVTGSVGEPVVFSYAIALSVLVTLPPAFVCGWLFSAIVSHNGNDATSLLQVYYSEGSGAFVACVLIAVLTVNNVSTLCTAGGLSCVVMAALPLRSRMTGSKKHLQVAGLLGLAVGALIVGPQIDVALDSYKYRPYETVAAYDTPYSHQTLLLRGGARVALTDNSVESVEGDIQTAENTLLPPLAYFPEARNVLIIGQTDLTLRPLILGIPRLSITEVDLRPPLGERIRSFDSSGSAIRYVQEDPISYLSAQSPGAFDVIIYPLGESGSQRGLRLMTSRALLNIRRVLSRHGVLHVITSYDSDTYVMHDDDLLLSTIRRTLAGTFARVIIWPGNSTLFLAGDSSLPDLSPDSIAARLDRLSYEPQFLNASYLLDRLSPGQVERIDRAASGACAENSVERPTLANLQIAKRSRIHAADRWVADLMIENWLWEAALILVIVAIAISATVRGGRSLGRALYVATGMISLVLELVSFYVYQSCAGMLYSHLSALVGSFMLGLALGVRVTMTVKSRWLAPGALALLIVTTIVFWATCLDVPPRLSLWYHIAFQFIVAFCTGGLFTAATRQCYGGRTGNGSFGYALELGGASVAALITIPVLLPGVGLNQLLAAAATLAGLLFLWALINVRAQTASRDGASRE
jgi:spermidine synthase